jgi:hypothetical protein
LFHPSFVKRNTLKCGTTMQFPFNKSNILPFMLTKRSLQNRKISHLTTSVHTLSTKGIFSSFIDRSVFNCDNFNMNPAQLELLKWHCQWCHCDLNRVQMTCSARLYAPLNLCVTRWTDGLRDKTSLTSEVPSFCSNFSTMTST